MTRSKGQFLAVHRVGCDDKGSSVARLRRVVRVLILALLPWTGVIGDLAAQVAGIAPHFRPVHEPDTWTGELNIGRMKHPAGAKLFGVRLSYEHDLTRVTLGLARRSVDPRTDHEARHQRRPICHAAKDYLGFEASFGFSLSSQDDDLGVVDVFVGFAANLDDAGTTGERPIGRQWDIPIGVTSGLNLATLPMEWLSHLEPWVAARLHVRKISGWHDDSKHIWRRGVGLSAGLRVRIAKGLGIQVALDRLYLYIGSPSETPSEYSWSIGAHLD